MNMQPLNISRIFQFLIVVSIVLTTQSCGNAKADSSNDLVVEEQADSAITADSKQATFKIDVPTDGSRVLVDSVMALINREMYKACEDCVHLDEGVTSFSPKEVFTDDGKQFVKHYMKKYKVLIQDSLWKTYYDFTLKMEAQTKKYVTYGMEHVHCGGSCSSQKYYYTFDKRNGHQIQEIINHDNFVRFLGDHPEYATIQADAWSGTPRWKFYPDDEITEYYYGLLDDHFSLVIKGVGNHYLIVDIPYNKISSYLSPEVQELVK